MNDITVLKRLSFLLEVMDDLNINLLWYSVEIESQPVLTLSLIDYTKLCQAYPCCEYLEKLQLRSDLSLDGDLVYDFTLSDRCLEKL